MSEPKLRIVTPEQYQAGYVVRLFTANPMEVKFKDGIPYRYVGITPDGNYIVEEPEQEPAK